MPVVEVLRFPASEAFISNRASTAKPLLDIASAAEGNIHTFYGLQIEDNKTGFVVIVWETYEHHKKLIDSPSYRQVREALGPLVAGEPQMLHVSFNTDITAAFKAPTTEFAFLKAKAGSSKKDCEETIQQLLDLLAPSKGLYPPPAWGESREVSDLFVTTIGWENVDAHVQAANQEEVKLSLGKGAGLFDATVTHVKLTRHE
ncbi:hypothetical protein AX17_006213 [Amanita inopinata Kibby_2008]|nr:hypothetical protein AX17_006213 [Amanita inopinata Kibby_2008]